MFSLKHVPWIFGYYSHRSHAFCSHTHTQRREGTCCEALAFKGKGGVWDGFFFLVWMKRLYFLTDASVIMERGAKCEGEAQEKKVTLGFMGIYVLDDGRRKSMC